MGCFVSASVSPQSETDTSSKCTSTPQTRPTTNRNRVRPLPPLEKPSFHDIRENPQCVTTRSPISRQPIRTSLETKHSDGSNQLPNNVINILLLGESGVGKSTFINAIVNYFKFDTLEKARAGKPVALMPVSFLLTVGDQFEEHIVRFGDEDPNENHHHPGQSVTQHCRSYVFTIGTQTKIRLIDTPGMGDTRGLDQDDLNMQHILSFINNLSHLNAICILLKPNESRLNVVFRSYFTRLLGFLGEDFRNNIVFCFTNTRSTFFAPGNTGPLLKEMLESHSMKDIPFKKTNTFCFDSESFRYLIAQQNGIEFDDYQKEEYQRSWVTSASESNRLFGYICGALKAYPQTEWKSIEHAQFQINQLIRPVLEAIRNILRNIILQTEKTSKRPILLVPKMISRPSTICNTCERTPRRYSDFWILPDDLHYFSDKCADCECSRKRHVSLDYQLEYALSDDVNRQFMNEMQSNLDYLKQASQKFGCFFYSITHTSEVNGPVLSYLNQMIEEENKICQQKGTPCLNSILHTKLNQFREEYNQTQNISMSNRNSIHLAEIYKLIESVTDLDLIRKQIDVIKRYHQKYMSEQETEIL
jgi:GTPase SAR1 family protein